MVSPHGRGFSLKDFLGEKVENFEKILEFQSHSRTLFSQKISENESKGVANPVDTQG